jgi:hypothetical protein
MNEQFPKINNKEKELRENIFLNIIFKDIFEEMFETIYEVGYNTEEDIEHFKDIVMNISTEERKKLFSLPYELLERRFEIFHSQGVTLETAVRRLISEAEESGYTLGYHLSPFDISPERGKNGTTWKIKGTELDDRDEKPMAYYSLDFDNLYRKHHQKYLYIVRAQTGENSSHKYDPSNNWGRASELSIVEHFDFEKIDEEIKRRAKEHENEVKKAA